MDFRGMPVDDEDDSGDGMYIDRGAVEEYTQSYEVDFRSSTGSESKCEGAFYPIMLYVLLCFSTYSTLVSV